MKIQITINCRILKKVLNDTFAIGAPKFGFRQNLTNKQ